MRTRKRYKLDRVAVAPRDSRSASWTFAGDAERGTEYSYEVIDGNLPSKNIWDFIVQVPESSRGRVIVRPRTAPNVKAWAELPDRSLTFTPATRPASRGQWYAPVALADVTGERSRAIVRADQRHALPHWFAEVENRLRRKEAVRPTKGTDANALVVLVPAGDYAAMIRMFFATKVWVLSEGFSI